jgi:hypothetical protein
MTSRVAELATLLRARALDRTVLDGRPVDPEALVSSGIPAIDGVLGGGWRRGEVSEVWGARSSGRMTVLVSTLAKAVAPDEGDGEVAALVDPFDRFDPVSAAAAGLALDRVLWVRGPALSLQARPALVEAALKRAVRAFDLVIRATGFAVVALDLADVPARRVRDLLPWSTWMRLARVNEGQRTVCLLVGDGPISRSPRGASIHLESIRQWTGGSLQTRQFAGLKVRTSRAPRTSHCALGPSDVLLSCR